jgi:hypothetical protein
MVYIYKQPKQQNSLYFGSDINKIQPKYFTWVSVVYVFVTWTLWGCNTSYVDFFHLGRKKKEEVFISGLLVRGLSKGLCIQ